MKIREINIKNRQENIKKREEKIEKKSIDPTVIQQNNDSFEKYNIKYKDEIIQREIEYMNTRTKLMNCEIELQNYKKKLNQYEIELYQYKTSRRRTLSL